jgi:hypothetical protein
VGYTCTTCGQGGADDFETQEKIKAFFNCHVCDGIMFPSEIAKPYIKLKKAMPRVPPPDLGELHGVKLPAWMWQTKTKEAVYVMSSKTWYGCVPIVRENELVFTEYWVLTAYTGQDLQQKHSVDELKRMARLV